VNGDLSEPCHSEERRRSWVTKNLGGCRSSRWSAERNAISKREYYVYIPSGRTRVASIGTTDELIRHLFQH